MTRAFLENQSRIAVNGPDAHEFLQGLITTDLDTLQPGAAAPGALLTPQGKIFFFFLISKESDGFSIEIESSEAATFTKRLTLYKLRAKVEISAAEATGTIALWDEPAPQGALKDLRFEKAGIDLYRLPGNSEFAGGGDRGAYDALRIDACIPEPGADFALQDAFPHDVLFDKSGGVSFKKGCYVGQEVVSRMQHRATARRRVVRVEADRALPASGSELTAGAKSLGQLGTVAGSKALAIIRIDRAGAAISGGVQICAGDIPVSVTLPAWSGLEFPSVTTED